MSHEPLAQTNLFWGNKPLRYVGVADRRLDDSVFDGYSTAVSPPQTLLTSMRVKPWDEAASIERHIACSLPFCERLDSGFLAKLNDL
jgi:hypothetical protein